MEFLFKDTFSCFDMSRGHRDGYTKCANDSGGGGGHEHGFAHVASEGCDLTRI